MVTMTTSQPRNLSELQLFRVLQRANLLQYYEIFIQQGGDDVQQLCEAGEEEFLEIMALVGMASKPLHVRRLQKSLHDWMKSPSIFQQPIGYMEATSSSSGLLASIHPSEFMFPSHHSPSVTLNPYPAVAAVASTPTDRVALTSTSPNRAPLSPAGAQNGDSTTREQDSATPSPTPVTARMMDFKRSPSPSSSTGTERTSYSPGVPAVLTDGQVTSIAEAAKHLSETLPEFQPKPLNSKKQICKEIEELMKMPMEDPARLDLMRKYAAIYGRFDSKRKLEKPMSLHEVSVNEAAAQLCYCIPALLTRREELFPLARQVVRESGYQYAKGHSRAHGVVTPTKRPKFEVSSQSPDIPEKFHLSRSQREERLEAISRELIELASRLNSIRGEVSSARQSTDYNALSNLQRELESLMSRQVALVIEQNDLRRRGKRGRPRKQPLVISPDNDSTKVGTSSCSSHESEADHDLSGFNALFSPCQGQGNSSSGMKDIMFDEGLRIAKQFGLADFAEELIGLKTEVESVTEDTNEDREVQGQGQKFNNDLELKKSCNSDSSKKTDSQPSERGGDHENFECQTKDFDSQKPHTIFLRSNSRQRSESQMSEN